MVGLNGATGVQLNFKPHQKTESFPAWNTLRHIVLSMRQVPTIGERNSRSCPPGLGDVDPGMEDDSWPMRDMCRWGSVTVGPGRHDPFSSKGCSHSDCNTSHESEKAVVSRGTWLCQGPFFRFHVSQWECKLAVRPWTTAWVNLLTYSDVMGQLRMDMGTTNIIPRHSMYGIYAYIGVV